MYRTQQEWRLLHRQQQNIDTDCIDVIFRISGAIPTHRTAYVFREGHLLFFFKEILSNVSKCAFVIPYHPGLYLFSRAVHILVSAFSLCVWRIYCEKNWLNAWLNTNGARRNNLYSILYWKKSVLVLAIFIL